MAFVCYSDHFCPLFFQLREKSGTHHDLLSRIHEVQVGDESLSLV